MRFIHIADVHLGVIPDAGMPWSETRSRDIWNSFRLVIDQARTQQVDLLLIAGDLFHRQPLKRELKEIAAWFAEIPETEVVLIAGNHDFLHTKSYYRTFSWPENVHFILERDLTAVHLERIHTTVWGCSFWDKEDARTVYSSNILRKMIRNKAVRNVRDAEYDVSLAQGTVGRLSDLEQTNQRRENFQILLGHGGDDRHHPFRAGEIAAAGFDYAAFGHIHKAAQLIPGKVVMAGALEPTDCNDFGPHGFWMGEMTERGTHVSFYPIKKCEYICQEVNVTPEMSSHAVAEQVHRELEQRESYQISHVILRGYRDADISLPLQEIGQMNRVVRVKNETEPDYQFEQLKQKYDGTLLQKYIEVMEQYPDPVQGKKALYYGVQAMLNAMGEGQET
ncbi:metallophosphoesterase [uncultured Eubacterium sp.]|uniref:metallophosphoesterase family protein n=1 Tax=uncultured Eubacterium sp. TaxID=165185 RepID=UPI0025E561F4|nr:metallophosphoesterase [uncultured Eubacterium sp.]